MGLASALTRSAVRSATRPTKPKSSLRKILDDLPEDKKVDIPEDQPEGGVFGFHGTARERAADEDFFDITFGNPNDEFLGQGFYFTINPTRADEYANIRAIKDLGKPLTKNEEYELGLNPIGQGSQREGIHRRSVSDPNRILTTESVLKGQDIEGNSLGSGQQIVKVDLSNIENPFVVRTNKQRLQAKQNIEGLKEQGYDSIIFDDLTDRSQQILVFPEHIDKVKSTLAPLSGRSPAARQTDKLMSTKTEPTEINAEYIRGLDLYHGTTATKLQGGKFKASKEGSIGRGVYATPDTEFSKIYAKGEGGNIHPVKVNIKNPLIVRIKGRFKDYIPARVFEELGVPTKKAYDMADLNAEQFGGDYTTQFKSRAQKQGYDSIAVVNDETNTIQEIVVFDPDKVASKFKPTSTARQTDELLSPKKSLDDATASRDEIRKFYDTPKNLRQKQKPQLEKAAQLLYDEKITKSEWDEIADSIYPPQTITEMPDFPHINRVAATLNENQVEKGIIGKTLESAALAGKRIASRLDINAYDRFKTWVVSLHDGTKKGGPAIGYGQTAKLKNVEFISSEKGALNIARGKTDKGTIARIYGDWVDETPQDVYDFAARELNNPDSEWVQIGMNPYKHSYFYDKRTMEPILTANEVIQVGPLVLAKNVTRGKAADFKFNKGGMMYEQQMNMFQEGGVMLEDEGGAVEETSGNDVPLGGVKEGVADDQPAQLSAGEMVLSEDVVRYHGVEKIMALRDEAKIGYHKMEAMGQLGNSDEATIPTEAIFNPGGMPFSVVDLEYIEMGDDDDEAEVMAMADNEDEPIKAQAGTLVPVQQPAASFSRINPATGLPEITTAPATSVPQVLQPGTPAPITTGSALTPTTLSSLTPTSTPISAPDRPATQQPASLTQLPSAQQFLGGVQSTNFFINEIGQVIQIPVINGKQLFEEPEGFQPHDPTNPVPFDPDLEDSGVTTPDEQPQRQRTVTDREEGGQPDVGPSGFDTTVEGLGLDEPGTISSATVDAVNNATTVTELGLAMAMSGFDIENPRDVANFAKDLENRARVESLFGVKFGSIIGTATKDATKKNQALTSRLSRTLTPEEEDKARLSRWGDRPAFTRRSAVPVTPVQQQRYGPSLVSGAAGTSADTSMGMGFGTSEAESAAAAAGGVGRDDPEAPGVGGFGYLNKGGLISPRLHRKRMKKNNRKGLAAPK